MAPKPPSKATKPPQTSSSLSPLTTLTALFFAHRLILITLVAFTPSSYDTSAALLLPPPNNALERFLQKTTSWDAIYFVSLARRGYIFEQEWAFGWGFTRVVGWIGRTLLGGVEGEEGGYAFVLAGVVLSNLAHYASVLTLYALTRKVFASASKSRALLVGALHVLSPAGIFLYAPAPEALFSLLTFLGSLLFVLARQTANASLSILYTLLMGLSWGAGCTVRGNGILNGAVVLIEFVGVALGGMTSMGALGRFLALGVAGVMVGVGFVGPQVIAWFEYCGGGEAKREWCAKALPSIYSFVQEHYWDVGFLRYWTPSNIPLFLLAFPMLALLLLSSRWSLTQPPAVLLLAIPQALLALLAFTNFHVQIILRLASGCIVWYWFVADGLSKGERWADWTVKWMVGYAAVQAVLYAAFLPPA